MKISQVMLRNILPDNLMKSVRLGNAYKMASVVGRHYCSRMTLSNKCPLKCEDCRSRLEEAVELLKKNNANINSPVAVFIYNLRNQVNTVVETQPKIKTIKKDLHGIPEEETGTVWENMLAGL